MKEHNWPVWATEEIVIVDYNPAWPSIAAELEVELKSLYDFNSSQFVHIGSTAVPNLPAKPVIDLMVAIPDFSTINAIETALQTKNWHLIPPDLDNREYRRTFVKVVNNKRFAHLHLILNNSDELVKHIAFRDILRHHPATADEYAQLKKELAEIYKNDRDAYTNAKTAFIIAVLDKYLS